MGEEQVRCSEVTQSVADSLIQLIPMSVFPLRNSSCGCIYRPRQPSSFGLRLPSPSKAYHFAEPAVLESSRRRIALCALLSPLAGRDSDGTAPRTWGALCRLWKLNNLYFTVLSGSFLWDLLLYACHLTPLQLLRAYTLPHKLLISVSCSRQLCGSAVLIHLAIINSSIRLSAVGFNVLCINLFLNYTNHPP